MNHILSCESCGKFTMNEDCSCGGKTFSTQPGKYSPTFKHKKERREARKEGLEKEGLL